MLSNICYWWFFLSQGYQWTKYLAHSKIWRPKSCLQMFVSLVALDGSCLLLFTRLTADLTLVDPCFIHCHIFMQKFFFVVLKQLQKILWIIDTLLFLIHCEQSLTHFKHSFLIDKCSCKIVNTLSSDIFNSSAITCNFYLRWAKMSLWSFLLFSWTTVEFGWPEHSASFVSVQLHLKSTYHLLTIVSDRAV